MIKQLNLKEEMRDSKNNCILLDGYGIGPVNLLSLMESKDYSWQEQLSSAEESYIACIVTADRLADMLWFEDIIKMYGEVYWRTKATLVLQLKFDEKQTLHTYCLINLMYGLTAIELACSKLNKDLREEGLALTVDITNLANLKSQENVHKYVFSYLQQREASTK